MTGRTGYTEIDNGDAPDFGPQITSAFEHFDPLIGETAVNAAALPASGNWQGRTIMAEDTKIVWLNTDGTTGWKAIAGQLPYCILSMTSAQNGGNGAYLTATWDNEVADASGMHTGSQSRITVPYTGRYRVSWRVASATSTATFFGTRLLVGGSPLAYTEMTQTPTANSAGNHMGSTMLALSATNYIEVQTYTVSGQALTVAACRFIVEYVGP